MAVFTGWAGGTSVREERSGYELWGMRSRHVAVVNPALGEDPQWTLSLGGDYRLRGSSPCVGSGFFADWMSGATDLRGRNRSFGGKVSMGAYEGIPNGLSILIR